MTYAGWLTLIEQHFTHYPEMTARDVYKLLYQGILGPEHIMPSAEVFSTHLEAELATLQPEAGESLLEAIRPDGALSRINLRAWLALGQDPSWLVEACLEAGKQPWGTPKDLSLVWYQFMDAVEESRFPGISSGETMALDNWIREDNFPVAHHSSQYQSLYKPAYRLVTSYPGSIVNEKGQLI